MRPFLHVAEREAWAAAQASGSYPVPGGGPFTHGCFPEQLPGVLQRFYAGRDHAELVLLEVDPEGLPVEVEAAEDGAGDFPHVHGPIPVGSVRDTRPV